MVWATRPDPEETFTDFQSLQVYLEDLTGPEYIYVYVYPVWNSNNPNVYRSLERFEYAVYRSEPTHKAEFRSPSGTLASHL